MTRSRLAKTFTFTISGSGISPASFGWARRWGAYYLARAIRALPLLCAESVEAAFVCIGEAGARQMLDRLETGLTDRLLKDEETPDDMELFARLAVRDAARKSSGYRRRFGNALLEALDSHGQGDGDEDAADESEAAVAIARATEIVRLDRVETELLRFLACLDATRELAYCLDDRFEIFHAFSRTLLADVLGYSRAEVSQALTGRLQALELVRTTGPDTYSLGDTFLGFADAAGGAEGLPCCRPAEKPQLSEEDFLVDAGTVGMLEGMLRAESDTPTHVLLYGPAGTGKTQFARTLAASLGMKAL
ncbi:MAG: ATP-binding protein, partial [Deltaproteobacteria bacterium]|nr:ATP-binding protein [Deltaproteobacteria bacterium]